MVDGPPVLMGAPSEPDPPRHPPGEDGLTIPLARGDRTRPRSEIHVLVADDVEAMSEAFFTNVFNMSGADRFLAP